MDVIVENNLEQDTIRNILFNEKSQKIFEIFRNPGCDSNDIIKLKNKVEKIKYK